MITSLIWLFLSALANASAALFTKISTASDGIVKVTYLSAGVGCYFVAFVFYYLGLKSTQLSIAQPIVTSMAILLVALLSYKFLNEVFGVQQFFGAALLVISLFLISHR